MFLKKLGRRLKALLPIFDKYMEAHIDLALKITSRLKQILSSPVADIITAIIPGDIDNAIRQQLVLALGKAVEVLTIANTCRQQATVNDKLNCFVQQLLQHDPQLQDAMLQKLASLLAGYLDGQQLKQHLYDLYTQARYSDAKIS